MAWILSFIYKKKWDAISPHNLILNSLELISCPCIFTSIICMLAPPMAVHLATVLLTFLWWKVKCRLIKSNYIYFPDLFWFVFQHLMQYRGNGRDTKSPQVNLRKQHPFVNCFIIFQVCNNLWCTEKTIATLRQPKTEHNNN